ncbi:hypothetical protein ACF05T_32420 [Streptomyces lateritius]|uniref:Uncharacterized protein n=1 Tax=Streptomyces lateritius TaxID=67313 RepID=A0ABW6YLF1_9ACTN
MTMMSMPYLAQEDQQQTLEWLHGGTFSVLLDGQATDGQLTVGRFRVGNNLKVEPARRIGRLPKEKQAEEAQKAMTAAKTPRQRSSRSETGEGQTINAVNTPAAGADDQAAPDVTVNAVNTPAAGADEQGSLDVTVNGVNTPVTGQASI